MYCVNCGVKLADGSDKCPLCYTPVWHGESFCNPTSTFSSLYPDFYEAKKHVAFLFTIFFLILSLTVFIVWLNVGMGLWGKISLLSILMIYLCVVLPLWFRKYMPFIWIPVIHTVTAGYLLYICYISNGNWFLSFAFPLVCINCLLITLFGTLIYFKMVNCFVIGAATICYGSFTILIEFFDSLTFGVDMFQWSIYSAGGCLLIGILFILSGIIKPFRNFMKKNLFF